MNITITGQLALLMLTERHDEHSINVVSASTYGFVSLMPKHSYETYNIVCKQWETETGFVLEENRYKALYSRDVNNYLAVTDKGAKGKGIFTINEISKNPQAPICIIAVKDLLVEGKPIRKTILECKDLTEFLTVRRVTGVAVWGDDYLGKVVGWIYSTKGGP